MFSLLDLLARRRRLSGPVVRTAFLLMALGSMGAQTASAEPAYPFEGTWIRSDHACVATSVPIRVYTAKEVTSPRGRCSIRRISTGSGVYELNEECRRADRSSSRITEIVRPTGADNITLRRQVERLKIPRKLRLTRCTIAGSSTRPAAAHPPH